MTDAEFRRRAHAFLRELHSLGTSSPAELAPLVAAGAASDTSRIDRLRAALTPFAQKWDRAMDRPVDERFNPGVLCALGEFKAAAEALAADGVEG